MRFENEVYYDFADVLIKPKRSTLTSRKDVDVTRTFTMKHSGAILNVTPIIAANMDTVGTQKLALEFERLGLMTALHKHYTIDELVSFYFSNNIQNTWYTIGVVEKDLEKYNQVQQQLFNLGGNEKRITKVCIDVPNMYSEYCVDFVKRFREDNPEVTLLAGNVATGEQTEQLILSGVDIVKLGIGPGSACTTRKMTGVGVPQLSCVIECADSAHGLGGQVCSDGGITCPGDLAKAFGAGADFIMMGGVFAGHEENSTPDADGMADFYGMSSAAANEKYSGGLKTYRASEGRELKIPFKGPVAVTVQEYLGGLRSMMTYIGARKLKDVSKCTTFIRVNRQLNTSLVK